MNSVYLPNENLAIVEELVEKQQNGMSEDRYKLIVQGTAKLAYKIFVGALGVEPSTSVLSGPRSNQMS